MTISSANQRVMVAVLSNSKKKLPYQSSDGSSPLLVALPNDYLSATLDRVRETGGAANVAVADLRGFRIVVLQTDLVSADDDEEYPDDMSMGMFLIKTGSRKGSWRFRLSGMPAGLSSPSDLLAYA